MDNIRTYKSVNYKNNRGESIEDRFPFLLEGSFKDITVEADSFIPEYGRRDNLRISGCEIYGGEYKNCWFNRVTIKGGNFVDCDFMTCFIHDGLIMPGDFGCKFLAASGFEVTLNREIRLNRDLFIKLKKALDE